MFSALLAISFMCVLVRFMPIENKNAHKQDGRLKSGVAKSGEHYPEPAPVYGRCDKSFLCSLRRCHTAASLGIAKIMLFFSFQVVFVGKNALQIQSLLSLTDPILSAPIPLA